MSPLLFVNVAIPALLLYVPPVTVVSALKIIDNAFDISLNDVCDVTLFETIGNIVLGNKVPIGNCVVFLSDMFIE